jgi:transposase
VLQSEGVESHVVDPASIATSRRRRRAKTDKIDGEALLRALLAYKRGEPRVCAMVKAPTPDEEDRRRVGRERKVLIAERVKHVNRVKGLFPHSFLRIEASTIAADHLHVRVILTWGA